VTSLPDAGAVAVRDLNRHVTSRSKDYALVLRPGYSVCLLTATEPHKLS